MKSLKVLLAVTMVAAVMVPGIAEAKKKPASSNGAPTAEQRKRAWEEGMKYCRKKYGADLAQVRVEKFYGKWSTVCYHY